jgi:hypothetical protein
MPPVPFSPRAVENFRAFVGAGMSALTQPQISDDYTYHQTYAAVGDTADIYLVHVVRGHYGASNKNSKIASTRNEH